MFEIRANKFIDTELTDLPDMPVQAKQPSQKEIAEKLYRTYREMQQFRRYKVQPVARIPIPKNEIINDWMVLDHKFVDDKTKYESVYILQCQKCTKSIRWPMDFITFVPQCLCGGSVCTNQTTLENLKT